MSHGAGTPDSSDHYTAGSYTGGPPAEPEPVDAFEALTLDQQEREAARLHERDLTELAYYADHVIRARRDARRLLETIEAMHTGMERAIHDRGYARQLVSRRGGMLTEYDLQTRALGYHLGGPYTRQSNLGAMDQMASDANA